MNITIHRALRELKLLDQRIGKKNRELSFIDVSFGRKAVKGYDKNEEYERRVKEHYQSIMSLIKRRQTIKSKIVESNATTSVEIDSVKMTVADAIERKDSIEYEKMVQSRLRNDYSNALYIFDTQNDEVDRKIDGFINQLIGKEGKAKQEEIDAVTKPYKEQHEPKLIDPLNIKNLIEKLAESVENFEADVDIVLSESNGTTFIEIDD